NILQTKASLSHSFNAALKDYWVLNNFNHIYTSFGINTSFNDFFSEDVQILSNGNINNFNVSNFGNDFTYNFINTFLGVEYKFQIGIATFKPAVFYHGYLWRAEQFNEANTFSKTLILPQFTSKVEFNNSEKLLFRYRQRLQFPTVNRLAGNFVLNSFNSVLLGNPDLQNERIHNYSLNYYKFSLFRGLNVNTGINYSRKSQSVKNTTALDGIEQFATYTMFNEPENSVSANFNFSKRMNTVKLGLDSRTSYSEFFQLVNANVSKNFSRSLSLTGKMETLFENWPNLELGYTYEPSVFTTSVNRNQFTNTEFFAGLDYVFLKDFHLKADYRRTDYENQSQNLTNIFDLANASLYYQKDDSPWGFEVLATNLFDIRFRRSNSFSDFLISDQTTFIIPRIIMFKIAYKL
ncbi:MAG: carboxypeptidase regulatory-like domain-containing protein, partial [Bacteroidota bacterium]